MASAKHASQTSKMEFARDPSLPNQFRYTFRDKLEDEIRRALASSVFRSLLAPWFLPTAITIPSYTLPSYLRTFAFTPLHLPFFLCFFLSFGGPFSSFVTCAYLGAALWDPGPWKPSSGAIVF